MLLAMVLGVQIAVAAVGHEEGLTETEPPIAYCISMLLAMLEH